LPASRSEELRVPLVLDPETGCLPADPALQEATLDEVRAAFVEGFPTSETRPAIWGAYEEHTSAWKPLLGQVPREQWLDGSFVTAKLDPGDLDLAVFAPLAELLGLSAEQRRQVERMFGGAQHVWGGWLHAVMVPTADDGTPEATVTMAQRALLLQLWCAQKPGDGGVRKGVARLWR
jgi:hypothetical protein